MANVTTELETALEQHNVTFNRRRRRTGDITDEFLQEAYRINGHILSLRQYLVNIRSSYLSTSQTPSSRRPGSTRPLSSNSRSTSPSRRNQDSSRLTDAQRDQIDAEAKTALRDLHQTIRQLAEAEQVRIGTEVRLAAQRRKRRNPLAGSALARWAAGDDADSARQPAVDDEHDPSATPEERAQAAGRKQLAAAREGVIWYLSRGLDAAAGAQRSMMTIRVEREEEKRKTAQYANVTLKTNNLGSDPNASQGSIQALQELARLSKRTNKPSAADALANGAAQQDAEAAREAEQRRRIEQTLSPEQLQLFEQENDALLQHYEDTLDQVQHAERSALEIAELQTTLASHLEIQSSRIDQLTEDAATTTDRVTKGNTELRRAAARPWYQRPARAVFWGTCMLCGTLIAWDLIF